MNQGDRVRILREWCDSDEEHDQVHVVIEDRGDRVLISPEKWPYKIVPQECVEASTLEPVRE